MKNKHLFYLICTIVLTLFVFSCSNDKKQNNLTELNLDHLLHLYDTVNLPGNVPGGIVHIYSEYPDYSYEIEPNEGYTCVDDVARAMMIGKIRFGDTDELQNTYQRMTEFLLYMQAENGWFYNFIWNDLSINKTYRTSLPEPNWWSWRAFWALSNYNGKDEILNLKVRNACERLAENLFQTYTNKVFTTDTIQGVVVPTWLPLGTAGDQAGILIMGLESYYRNIKNDERVLALIQRLADGIILTQKGDVQSFPFGAFMSWQNMWHAYGNSQAYAMLRAGLLLNNAKYTESALLEINNFYPYLIQKNYPAYFKISKNGDHYEIAEEQQFSQIAYGFRPLIWACAEAFKISHDEKYRAQAQQIARWFEGQNVAHQQMYDPATGRCFDGIVSETKVNLNSGAESTIEALLAIEALNKIQKK